MSSIINSYTIFKSNPYIFSTSNSNSIDVRGHELITTGESFLGLLSEVGTCSNSYSQRHHFEPVAIYNFLGHVPISQDPPLGSEEPFEAPNPVMRGLKADHVNRRWTRVHPDLVPRDLGNVELFRPVGPTKEHSFSFGDAITGGDARFDRAVLVGVFHEHMPDKTYLLAVTDQRKRVIVIKVPSDSVVPRWPAIHSPHLQLITRIAPDIAGLLSAGNHEIRQRVATLGTPTHAARSCLPGHNFQDLPGVEEEWVEPDTTFPVLAKHYGMGDWLQAHSHAFKEPESSPPTPSERESFMIDNAWPRPPSHPNLESIDTASIDTI
ncbi:hypothetical protein AAF712_016001 [Marasmius tenuissimus]|uniref:Uncharacterized protein n=1 Tax=Marasmius tenuissimus TaxID=585030 RepID=A0ABR2Z9D0_9AGAR